MNDAGQFIEISCPQCHRVYRLDPGRIPAGTKTARCSGCGQLVPLAPLTAARPSQPAIRDLTASDRATALAPITYVATPPTARRWPWGLGGGLVGLLVGLAAATLLLSGAAPWQPQPTAATGDTVIVEFTGKLRDGTIVETTRGHDPRRFVIGSGKVLAGFEQSVIGKRPGDTWTVTLTPQQAFGPHREGRVITIARARLPSDTALAVGNRVRLEPPNGKAVDATVVQFSKDTVTLDTNHPLAGQELVFDIQLLQVVKKKRYVAPRT